MNGGATLVAIIAPDFDYAGIDSRIAFGNIIYRVPYLRPSERLHRIALLGLLPSSGCAAAGDTVAIRRLESIRGCSGLQQPRLASSCSWRDAFPARAVFWPTQAEAGKID
jgi:hypothetical protein